MPSPSHTSWVGYPNLTLCEEYKVWNLSCHLLLHSVKYVGVLNSFVMVKRITLKLGKLNANKIWVAYATRVYFFWRNCYLSLSDALCALPQLKQTLINNTTQYQYVCRLVHTIRKLPCCNSVFRSWHLIQNCRYALWSLTISTNVSTLKISQTGRTKFVFRFRNWASGKLWKSEVRLYENRI